MFVHATQSVKMGMGDGREEIDIMKCPDMVSNFFLYECLGNEGVRKWTDGSCDG